ncbi:poly [ADP-ribose] polymerase 2-like [Dendronephthya gigantea]|uniref:poly [ADP-ribose] polymerase 2-like n=1 Tax=Dendronephthya gigantea TaxID=151771 RepID=UPI00106D8704|nr:poly [ADP-ribose] polymerase 2-like [Dendronephthya gigantea]
MPPKRKTDDDANAVGNKKIKKENGGKVSSKEWEFGYGKNKWKPYDPTQNRELSEAFSSAGKTHDIKMPRAEFSVIFDRMVQRNKKTGWEVPVRCKLSDPTEDEKFIWQWKTGTNVWTNFSAGACRNLDAAVQLEVKTASFEDDKNQYSVNMVTKELVNNTSKEKGTARHITKEEAEQEAKTQAATPAPPKAKTETKKSKSSKAKATATVNGDKKEAIKSVVFKGKSPVDDACPIKNQVEVFCEGDLIWDAMLNQTNLKNNNNKYYLLQLLKDTSTNRYHVWFRWGQVGFAGQNSLFSYGGDLEEAKDVFMKKFSDKTKNHWEEKDCFEKVPGKYDLIIVDYNAEDKEETDAPPPGPAKPKVESKLDTRLQALIELICNIKNMEEAVKEMKYDTNKAPLGKLTKDQIKAGYEALKMIDQCIARNDFGSKLTAACDAFYTRIPHCFGMRQPPLIRTKDEVKLKIDLLETLGDIEIAMKVLKEELDENPIDSHYKALKCGLDPIDNTSDDFKMIETYVKNTHAKTHSHYSMTVEDVFEIDHPSNEKFVDHGNRKLLWHGSRLTNWVGILTQGLRIAPPEAPVTGYMFGKGVYFADMCSKSANYCYTNRRQNTGLLVLSEVSLGKTNDLLSADYDAAKLPKGCQSVKGCGSTAPDPKDDFEMDDGTVVPLGEGIETNVNNPNGYTLNYNEFIVYDTKQIKLRYLVKCKFNYK